MTKPNIYYRTDIDGLRALAVVSAIIFHFNHEWLPGGFLGVDIFFVISGYLITSIIKKQILLGTFTFKEFYTRRIKRILPLFFTVLFCSFIFSIIILLPEDYKSFWRSARYAMQFRANRAFTGQDYFGIASEEKPLLHMWSLAIEEQFYFLWPLCFLLLYKFTKNSLASPLKVISIFVFLGIIVSTVLAQISIKKTPDDSYFLLQNRASELLVGCSLVFINVKVSLKVQRLLGIIGTLVIISCILFYNSELPYPGVTALLPTTAVALFIFDRTEGGYKKIFTNNISRTIGLWSFSLYLWHWPILAFMRYINPTDLPISWIFFAAALTIFLSFLSYNFIENPIRKYKWGFIKSLLFIYLIPMCMMFILNGFWNKTVIHIEDEKVRWFTDEEGCFDVINDSCAVGASNGEKRYLLIGDSHSMHLSTMMNLIGKKENITIDIISSSSCPIFFGYESRIDTNEKCLNANTFFADNWRNYDKILFSQLFYGQINRLTFKDSNKTYIEDFENTLSKVSREIPVIVISDIPEFNYNPLRSANLEGGFFSRFVPHDGPTNSYIQGNDAIKSAINGIPNVSYLDITPYVLKLLENGELIYRDQNHLSPYGSRRLGELFIQNNEILSD